MGATLRWGRLSFKLQRSEIVFAAPDGSRISLVRGGADRPATLDEVVLGYLASGRPSTAAAA